MGASVGIVVLHEILLGVGLGALNKGVPLTLYQIPLNTSYRGGSARYRYQPRRCRERWSTRRDIGVAKFGGELSKNAKDSLCLSQHVPIQESRH